jgi:hypothetical protein
MNDGTSSDDIFDERIRALAANHFNAPEGEPPRQAMWEGIAAARRAARAEAAATGSAQESAELAPRTIEITPLVPRRSHAAVWRWGAALAAGLVLGIVVDQRIVRDHSPAAAPGGVAVAPPVATPINKDSAATSRVASESTHASTPRERTTPTPSIPRSYASGTPVERSAERPRVERAPADSSAQALYRVAATQTLVQAEALLTSYRADEGSRDPLAMQQAARWARDVLSSTRLLIDSPAGRDPQMRALLGDLELILAQLVQLSGTPLQANERDLIERAMRERDLLPRLRSAVPAGLAAS